MSTRNGGETEGLAPVIPLFGARAQGDDEVGDDEGERDFSPLWHATWTSESSDGAREPHGRGAAERPGDVSELDEQRQRAERMLLRKLRTRSLSVREARAALVSAEIDGSAIEHVLSEFEQRGYLDDARLAEQLLDSALGRKSQGAAAIARTLSQRGLDREVIDIALASLPDDEAERALEFARQRVRSMSGLDRDVALRRLHGQLARRGFGGSTAMDAARRALDEDDS